MQEKIRRSRTTGFDYHCFCNPFNRPGRRTIDCFYVEVKYTLNTAAQGEIKVGFNSDDASYYTMDVSSTFAIVKGSGTHTFTSTVTPKNWGAGKHFQAYVNLVKTPHGSTYSPSASDTENLSF